MTIHKYIFWLIYLLSRSSLQGTKIILHVYVIAMIRQTGFYVTTQNVLILIVSFTDEIGADLPVDISRRFLFSAKTIQEIAMAVGFAHVLLLFAKGFLPMAESLYLGWPCYWTRLIKSIVISLGMYLKLKFRLEIASFNLLYHPELGGTWANVPAGRRPDHK